MVKWYYLTIFFMEKNLVYSNFLDLSQSISKEIFKNCNFPWEAIPLIKDFIITLGKSLPNKSFEEIKENVWISKNNVKIYPSAHIDGPAIVDENSEIRHCAFVRGNAIIGKNCIVGNSTELKNVILFNNVQVPHFNYVGDSILGYKSHLGAGAITSNVKSDRSLITVNYGSTKIKTNLKKFGAILGDHVEVGCNAVLNPGAIIGRHSSIYPTTMVRGVLDENTILKNTGEKIKKTQKN